jgi:hypothetical protein
MPEALRISVGGTRKRPAVQSQPVAHIVKADGMSQLCKRVAELKTRFDFFLCFD